MTPSLTTYGITLPIRYGEQGYFAQSFTLIEQVKSNLVMLLRTKKGERRMNPEFGSGLWSVLFSNVTDDLNPIIENTIRKDVGRWMPYVNVSEVAISVDQQNPNKLDVALKYTVPSIGVTEEQTLQVAMNTNNAS
jgi:phage baseplate assembly protein W